jgi:hypothetical protein
VQCAELSAAWWPGAREGDRLVTHNGQGLAVASAHAQSPSQSPCRRRLPVPKPSAGSNHPPLALDPTSPAPPLSWRAACRAEQTFSMAAATSEQREKQAELQGLLCGVVQVRAPRGRRPLQRSPTTDHRAALRPVCEPRPHHRLVFGAPLAPRAQPRRRCLPPQRTPTPRVGRPCNSKQPPQTLCTRLAKEDNGKAALLQYADSTMEALLRVLANPGQAGGAAGAAVAAASVHEEAMQVRGRAGRAGWRSVPLAASLSCPRTTLAALGCAWLRLPGSAGRPDVLRRALLHPSHTVCFWAVFTATAGGGLGGDRRRAAI